MKANIGTKNKVSKRVLKNGFDLNGMDREMNVSKLLKGRSRTRIEGITVRHSRIERRVRDKKEKKSRHGINSRPR